jgi:ABC-type glycerol-3-phosphate transport system permease component
MSTQTRSSRRRRDWPKHLVIWLLLGAQLFPVYMMVQVSMKDNHSFLGNPWWPEAMSHWKWENWRYAINLVLPYVGNTLFVASISTIGCLFLAVMAAYFFARHRMPFARLVWAAFLLLMLMPTVANIVPLFALLKSLNLLNTLWAIIIVGLAGSQVFCIYVLRHFIEEIPHDLFEAAEMDGASHWRQLVSVVLPMSMPILGTLGIVTFLERWNDFLLPLIILRDRDLFTGASVKQWGQIMAAFCVASAPLVLIFVFTMRWFVKGLAAGAIKG